MSHLDPAEVETNKYALAKAADLFRQGYRAQGYGQDEPPSVVSLLKDLTGQEHRFEQETEPKRGKRIDGTFKAVDEPADNIDKLVMGLKHPVETMDLLGRLSAIGDNLQDYDELMPGFVRDFCQDEEVTWRMAGMFSGWGNVMTGFNKPVMAFISTANEVLLIKASTACRLEVFSEVDFGPFVWPDEVLGLLDEIRDLFERTMGVRPAAQKIVWLRISEMLADAAEWPIMEERMSEDLLVFRDLLMGVGL